MSGPTYGAADYTNALQALLPRGRAWPRDADTVATKVITGLAGAFLRSDVSARDLLVQAFPATASDLLGEWEETVGLPARFSASAADTAARQQQVVAALTDVGGQSVSYFVALAAKLGVVVTIEQFKPFTVLSPVSSPIYGTAWAHSWRVSAPLSSTTHFGDVTDDVTESLLSDWQNVALETAFNLYKPAHSQVAFSYT